MMRTLAVVSALLLGISLSKAPPRCAAETAPTPPAIDILVAGIRDRLAYCDTAWTDMTYIATTYERRLNSDGTVKEETKFRARVYARPDQEREVLEAMWENGEPVSDKTLRKEREQRAEEKRNRSEGAEDKKKRDRRDIAVLEPFAADNSDKYQFPEITLDTIRGIEAWKIAVTPEEDTEELVRGFAWVRTDTYDAVAERYQPARLPSKLKALAFELEYEPIAAGCAMPQRFHIAGNGKVLLFIKFNFEAEVIIDSVEVNSGLPDSLFAVTDY